MTKYAMFTEPVTLRIFYVNPDRVAYVAEYTVDKSTRIAFSEIKGDYVVALGNPEEIVKRLSLLTSGKA